jgi:hypothetical protein
VNGQRLEGCRVLQSGDRIMLSKDSPEFLIECEAIPVSMPPELEQEAIAKSQVNPPNFCNGYLACG